MEDFKGIIKEWLELDEAVKSLKTSLKEKNTRMAKLSEYIITFMNSENKQVCNIGEYGSLELKTRNNSSSIKKEHIMDMLMKLSNNNEEKAKEHLDELYNRRTTSTKNVLKLSVNK